MITQNEAAEILGVTKQYVSKLKKQVPRPSWFADGGIDETHPEFLALAEMNSNNIKKKQNNKVVSEAKKRDRVIEEFSPEYNELVQRSKTAQLEDSIYQAEIKKQKAHQEEIKTRELKRELAPIGLLKHFFSFTENLIQRLYRRPHEIAPQLEALFLAGEQKKAVDLLRRELESIVIQCQKELVVEIESEGFRNYDRC